MSSAMMSAASVPWMDWPGLRGRGVQRISQPNRQRCPRWSPRRCEPPGRAGEEAGAGAGGGVRCCCRWRWRRRRLWSIACWSGRDGSADGGAPALAAALAFTARCGVTVKLLMTVRTPAAAPLSAAASARAASLFTVPFRVAVPPFTLTLMFWPFNADSASIRLCMSLAIS